MQTWNISKNLYEMQQQKVNFGMEAKIKNISVVGSVTQRRPKPKAVKSARVIFIAAALFSSQASLSSSQGEWSMLIVYVQDTVLAK